LRSIKDNCGTNGGNFTIVKISGLTQQQRQSTFHVQPFHNGPAVRDLGLVRRRITPEAGRGLEKLGHALEYLTDEFVHDGCRFSEDHGKVQAIQLLATLNRQIYFACSIEPTLRERVQGLFRRLLNQPEFRN
jgi:hypothetical protein